MDYEDMVEDELKPVEPAPESELVPEVEPDTTQVPRAKSPWKAIILTGFLAGLIGAVGGAAAVYFALEKHMSSRYMTAQPIKADIQRELSVETKKLDKRLETVELELANSPALSAMPDPVDLSDLEDRLTVLESAPSPEIDPAALTALQAAQKDGFEWPETEEIEAVLTQLDERLTTLEAGFESVSDETAEGLADEQIRVVEQTTASLQDLSERVAALETAPDEIQDLTSRLESLENRPPPAPRVERVSILAFPKAQMVEAVEANMEGGLFQKTLSRHIRVKDSDDPLTLIDGIENDLAEGRLAAAAEKFERLPAPVRTAGQAWYESVKASL